jgi:hypothetical protein
MRVGVAFGSENWRVIAGWGSVAIAVLVAFGSALLLHTIRSTGRREARRAGDIILVPLMTLPGFASSLLLLAAGTGLLGWLGDSSRILVDGAFGLWWLSNAAVIRHATQGRRRHERRPRVSVGVVTAAVVAAIGVWFTWASMMGLVHQLS